MKILLLGPLNSSFVKNDIDILAKQHNLSLIDTNTGGGLKGVWNLTKCTFASFFQVFRNEIILSWFADYTSIIPVLLAKILGKKTVIIAGGFDVGYLPELNYGAKARPIRWFCVSNSFKLADLILPLSKWADWSLHNLIALPNTKQSVPIHLGSKIDKFTLPLIEDRNFFLTVSQGNTEIEYIRKGSDKFIEIARAYPQYSFKIVGLRGAALAAAKLDGGDIPNLEIREGPLDLYKELISLYQQSFAYLQLSIEETFGVAVVEAMLCGCVPIIAPNAALPEVSGEYAQVIDTKDLIPNQNIDNILNLSKSATIEYREELSEFAKKYDIKYREEKLLNAINILCKK